MLAHPLNRELLPVGIAFGRVNAQNINACFDQCRNALGVIAGVNAGAHHVALVLVEHFQRILFVRIVVLAEHEGNQVVVFVNNGQAIQLVVPDDVVSNLERGIHGSHDHLLTRRHDIGNLRVKAHAAQTIIAAGHNAQKLARSGTVVGNGHGGMAEALFQRNHVGQRLIRRKISVRNYKAGLVVLHACDHGGFLLDGLVAVNEGQATFRCQRNSHLVIRNSCHNGGNHRNIQRKRAFLFALAITHQRRFQANGSRNAACRRVAGN